MNGALSILLCCAAWLFAIGCGSAAYPEAEMASAPAPGKYSIAYDADADGVPDAADMPQSRLAGAARPPPAEPALSTSTQSQQSPQPAAVAAPEVPNRLLIYTATLTLAVFETSNAIDAVEKLATANGGYLVRRLDTEIMIRVPAAKFTKVLESISQSGDELHREVNVQDVSEQYQDLQIRLRNAQAVLERLKTLLDKADTVKDALAVEAQFERVAQQIELLKGKLKRLKELIAFSTITVRYQARPTDAVDSEFNLPFPWLKQLGLPNLLRLEGN